VQRRGIAPRSTQVRQHGLEDPRIQRRSSRVIQVNSFLHRPPSVTQADRISCKHAALRAACQPAPAFGFRFSARSGFASACQLKGKEDATWCFPALVQGCAQSVTGQAEKAETLTSEALKGPKRADKARSAVLTSLPGEAGQRATTPLSWRLRRRPSRAGLSGPRVRAPATRRPRTSRPPFHRLRRPRWVHGLRRRSGRVGPR
jgi:hypothetical protein